MSEPTKTGLTVLWATEGSAASQAAIPLLRQIVLPVTSRLLVLTVGPHARVGGARPDASFLSRATAGVRRRAISEGLQTAQEQTTLLDPPGSVGVEATSRWGHPVEETLRAARSLGADLIVLGAKGHSDLRRFLLGSVAQGIVQNANRPVLVARPGSGLVRTVLTAYNGSPEARRGVDFLARLDPPEGTRMVLACVVELPATPTHLGAVGDRPRVMEALQALEAESRRLAERSLAAAGRRLDARWPVETLLLRGEVAPELNAAARREDAGLIVVGSRKPAPAGGYLVGSVAEKLVRHSQASLLVVR